MPTGTNFSNLFWPFLSHEEKSLIRAAPVLKIKANFEAKKQRVTFSLFSLCYIEEPHYVKVGQKSFCVYQSITFERTLFKTLSKQ